MPQFKVSGLEDFCGGKAGFNPFVKLGFLFEFRCGDSGLFSFFRVPSDDFLTVYVNKSWLFF